MQKKCIVQGCNKPQSNGRNTCDLCYMTLCSGVVPEKTKSFLKCIPYMRDLLFKVKAAPDFAAVQALVKDVEGDE